MANRILGGSADGKPATGHVRLQKRAQMRASMGFMRAHTSTQTHTHIHTLTDLSPCW